MESTETEVTPLVSPPVTLRVREYGDRASATHVVLMHGFPDDQQMWEPVVAALPQEWHVVTYDMRGAGGSTRPPGRASYRLAMLVEDLIAVLDATVPDGARVHLVGHDWGSCAGWDVIAAETWDPRLEGRIASWTSASGPPLDHLATLSRGRAGRGGALQQALHSWYVWCFLSPVLPELSWRRGQALMRPVMRRLDPTIELLPWGPEVTSNAVSTIDIYRANVLPRMRQPLKWRTCVPTQLVVALRDAFVVPASLEGLEARCRDLTRVEIDVGHWIPRARPEELAGLVEGFVRAHPA